VLFRDENVLSGRAHPLRDADDLSEAAINSMARWQGSGITSQNDRARAGRRTRGSLIVAAAVLLMLGSACGMLDVTSKATPVPTRSADQMTPPVVVTVGGSSVDATPTPGTAPTIPDSTPRPRIELPTRDPSAPPPPAPSPRSGASAAARAAQPPPI
jgi:hypothetical protein